MASSRKPNSNELRERVAGALSPFLAPGARLAAGLSGGLDSVVLFSILADLAPELGFSLTAIHVNHGISPNAARWADFCAELCRERGIPCRIETVDIAPHRDLGLEGAAREARYEAFARLDADLLALAQHRDDQAETVLLQLLRGAGVRGLSAMPHTREIGGGALRLVRPLLDVSRHEIASYAKARGLAWIEDESNDDTARKRNFLRHEVLPLLEREFPAAHDTLARAARHMAEADGLLDELARRDLEALGGAEMCVARLCALGEARAKNALRYACALRGIAAPGSARLEELVRQLTRARADAGVHITSSGWSFRRYRDRLYLEPEIYAADAAFLETWHGESALPLLQLGGVLGFKPEEGRGLSLEKLRQEPVTVRLRRGGERLRPDFRRPTRTLKNLFQERGVPPWRRDSLPLLYCGDHLVSVPGLGDDCEYQAQPGEPGVIVTWERLA
jgi:tRNA(Ile)-lysidine synthase